MSPLFTGKSLQCGMMLNKVQCQYFPIYVETEFIYAKTLGQGQAGGRWRFTVICSVVVLVTQSCPTLCNPMDCSLPGSRDFPGQKTGVGSVHFSKGSSQLKDWTLVSHIAGKFLTIRTTGKGFGSIFCTSLEFIVALRHARILRNSEIVTLIYMIRQ